MSNMDTLRDKILAEPAGMVGYVSGSLSASKKGTALRTDVLKKLFNHAGKPVPKEIEETTEASIALPRKELASLLDATAKKAGFGPLSRAKLYLETRLGF